MANAKPVMLRTSERTTYKSCRQKWDWAYNDRLKAKTSAPALRFGSLVHDALATYYKPGKKRGPHPAKTFNKVYKKELETQSVFGFKDEDGKWEEAGDMGVAMLRHYIDVYGDDGHLEIIAPEQPFQIDIHDRNGKYLVTQVGTFDATVKDHSMRRVQIGLLEHKTAASIVTSHLWGDEQAGSYFAFAPEWMRQKGILGKKENMDFILYNFLRKATKDERPQNAQGLFLNNPTKDALMRRAAEMGLVLEKKTIETLTAALEHAGEDPALLGEVSKSQPPPYFLRHKVFRSEADRTSVIHRVRAEAWEMGRVRKGKLPVYKNPGRDCGGCEFREMCEIHESGGAWEVVRDAMFKTWDPYESHEEK